MGRNCAGEEEVDFSLVLWTHRAFSEGKKKKKDCVMNQPLVNKSVVYLTPVRPGHCGLNPMWTYKPGCTAAGHQGLHRNMPEFRPAKLFTVLSLSPSYSHSLQFFPRLISFFFHLKHLNTGTDGLRALITAHVALFLSKISQFFYVLSTVCTSESH